MTILSSDKTSNKNVLNALQKYPEAEAIFNEPDPSFDGIDPQPSYVYVWYTVDDNKPFYIGRGVRNRYKHILWELKKKNKKSEIYRKLEKEHGIDVDFPYIDLSFHESKILAYATIRDALSKNVELIQNLSNWQKYWS